MSLPSTHHKDFKLRTDPTFSVHPVCTHLPRPLLMFFSFSFFLPLRYTWTILVALSSRRLLSCLRPDHFVTRSKRLIASPRIQYSRKLWIIDSRRSGAVCCFYSRKLPSGPISFTLFFMLETVQLKKVIWFELTTIWTRAKHLFI